MEAAAPQRLSQPPLRSTADEPRYALKEWWEDVC
jgi:hypothetical protein